MLQIECIDAVIACHKTFETKQESDCSSEIGQSNCGTGASAFLCFGLLNYIQTLKTNHVIKC